MAAADHMWPTSLGPRHGSVRDALRCSFSGRHPMLWPVNRLSWATAGSCKTTSRRHLSRSMNSPFALRPIPEYRCHPHLLTRRRQAFGQTQEISHGQEFKVHRLSPSYAADSSRGLYRDRIDAASRNRKRRVGPRARIGATSHCPASAPHRHARLSPALRSCLQSRDTDFTG